MMHCILFFQKDFIYLFLCACARKRKKYNSTLSVLLPLHHLSFNTLNNTHCGTKVVTFDDIQRLTFPFMDYAFSVMLKDPLPPPRSERFSLILLLLKFYSFALYI